MISQGKFSKIALSAAAGLTHRAPTLKTNKQENAHTHTHTPPPPPTTTTTHTHTTVLNSVLTHFLC